MYLLQSWKESLLFFKPINFKPLWHDFLKSMKSSYIFFLKYFWWLLIVYIVSHPWYFMKIIPTVKGLKFVTSVHFILRILIYFTFLVAIFRKFIRDRKLSILNYILYFLVWLLFVYCFDFALQYLSDTLSRSLFVAPPGPKYLIYMYEIKRFILSGLRVWFLYIPLICFVALSILEKGLGLSNIRAFTFALYNYPFCFIALVGLNTLFSVIRLVFKFSSLFIFFKFMSFGVVSTILNILFIPLYFSLFASFYYRRTQSRISL